MPEDFPLPHVETPGVGDAALTESEIVESPEPELSEKESLLQEAELEIEEAISFVISGVREQKDRLTVLKGKTEALANPELVAEHAELQDKYHYIAELVAAYASAENALDTTERKFLTALEQIRVSIKELRDSSHTSLQTIQISANSYHQTAITYRSTVSAFETMVSGFEEAASA